MRDLADQLQTQRRVASGPGSPPAGAPANSACRQTQTTELGPDHKARLRVLVNTEPILRPTSTHEHPRRTAQGTMNGRLHG